MFTTNNAQRPSSEVSLTCESITDASYYDVLTIILDLLCTHSCLVTHMEFLSSRMKSMIYSGYTTYTSIYQKTHSGHNTYTSTYQMMADSVSPTMVVGPQSSDVTAAKNEMSMFIPFIYYGEGIATAHKHHTC